MRIYFRHGLYRAEKDSSGQPVLTNSSSVGLTARVANGPIVWSIAHHEKNYTVSEYSPVTLASPFELSVGPVSWLYVDLNTTTGQKTYGLTYVEPTYGVAAPSTPTNDQHWFDTINFTTKVFSSTTGRWHERVRLVFGHWDGISFRPNAFGTAIGAQVPAGVSSGTIIYDGAGKVLKDSRDRFLTTEDKMFSDSASTHEFSLESNFTRATAAENIPAFHVVKWSDFNTVGLARYIDTSDAVIAIALHDATRGNPIELCVQGKIINDAWNWPTVNTKLWINRNGEFSAVDPYDLEPYDKRRVPVARVVDRNTIIFDQGLGGMGEKGDSGDVAGVFDASDVVKGITRLSVAPDNPVSPIAVGINDPILTAPRVPLEHGHPAIDVSVSPFGAFMGSTAQQALLYLFNTKLSLTGGTVTGNVTSTVGATADDHLATLNDVRTELALYGLQVKHFDLRTSVQPTLTQAFNALSASERTLSAAEILFVLFGTESYVWLGGTGGPLTATADVQFGLLGSFSGGSSVNVRSFSGNVNITEPVAASVYTAFGDQRNSFPPLYTTNSGSDYVKTYIAGLFHVDADLSNLRDEDVRIGVVYYGTASTGEAKLILNGDIIDRHTVLGGTKSASAYWETAFSDNVNLLEPGSFLSEFGFTYDNGGELYLGSDNVRSFYVFNHKDVKFGWLVHQETGLVEPAYNNTIWGYPPLMYTAVTPDKSDWTELAETYASPASPTYNFYNNPTSISLKVTLGGDAAGWQTTLPEGVASYNGVYTLLGYPRSVIGGEAAVHYVSGATLNTTTSQLDTWRNNDIFPVTGDVLINYVIPEQYSEEPSTWVGTREFPGIASTSMFVNNDYDAYIQAINTGNAISFEMAFVPSFQPVPPAPEV